MKKLATNTSIRQNIKRGMGDLKDGIWKKVDWEIFSKGLFVN